MAGRETRGGDQRSQEKEKARQGENVLVEDGRGADVGQGSPEATGSQPPSARFNI